MSCHFKPDLLIKSTETRKWGPCVNNFNVSIESMKIWGWVACTHWATGNGGSFCCWCGGLISGSMAWTLLPQEFAHILPLRSGVPGFSNFCLFKFWCEAKWLWVKFLIRVIRFHTKCKIWISHYAGSYYVDWIYGVDSQGRTTSNSAPEFPFGFWFQSARNDEQIWCSVSNQQHKMHLSIKVCPLVEDNISSSIKVSHN